MFVIVPITKMKLLRSLLKNYFYQLQALNSYYVLLF